MIRGSEDQPRHMRNRYANEGDRSAECSDGSGQQTRNQYQQPPGLSKRQTHAHCIGLSGQQEVERPGHGPGHDDADQNERKHPGKLLPGNTSQAAEGPHDESLECFTIAEIL